MLRMLQASASALLLLAPGQAISFESRWTSGLSVTTERLTGHTAVNGMRLRIDRATGRDVQRLAARILDDWQRESGVEHVMASSTGDWNLFSRIHRGESEVVQWRGADSGGELLWSSADLLHLDHPPHSTVPLPSDCHASPPVHGSVEKGGFIQRTGTCPGDVPNVAARFRRILGSSGWTTGEAVGSVLQAQRDGQKVQITLMRTSRPVTSPTTDVVVLELRASAP